MWLAGWLAGWLEGRRVVGKTLGPQRLHTARLASSGTESSRRRCGISAW